MSDNENKKIEYIMEVPDPLEVGGEVAKKRVRESPITSPSPKKRNVDPTEGDYDSASTSSLGNATDPDQQSPNEGGAQVQAEGNDIAPDSDDQDGGELGVVYNLTENESQAHLQDLSPSTGSPLPSQKPKPSVACNLDGPEDTLFESPNSDHVGDEDEWQVQPDDPIDPPNGKEIAGSDDQDGELSLPYYHLPASPSIDWQAQSVSNNLDGSEGNKNEPRFEQVNLTENGSLSQEQVEDLPSSPSPVFFDQDGNQPQEEIVANEDDEAEREYDQVVMEELRRISDDSASDGDDQDGELDGGSDGYLSDSNEEQEQQEHREDGEAADARLDLTIRANRRELERVTDLQPRVRLSKEMTARYEDFEIQKVIGLGAYGIVFVVRKLTGVDEGQVYAMKVIAKMDAIRSVDTASLVKNERKILEAIQENPYVVCLQYAFQSRRFLFLVMDFVQGGELFRHLFNHNGNLPDSEVAMYVAEVIEAVEQLHAQNIVYRDLKLENILINREGHIELVDFGLATILTAENEYRTNECCGTLEYMAPEVMQMSAEGYGTSVDWWSLGVLTVELLSGMNPFSRPHLPFDQQQLEISRSVLFERLQLPEGLSRTAADLVRRLLERDPDRRLDGSEIRRHPFFRWIAWPMVKGKRYRMPFLPPLDAADDVQHFDPDFTSRPAVLPQCEVPPHGLRLYRGYNYMAPRLMALARQHRDREVKYRNPQAQNTTPLPGNIKLGERIHSGRFGVCFQVNDNSMVKVIHGSTFRPTEVDALMSCSHTNIVTFFAVYQNKTEIWIMMEYLPGFDLAWNLRNNTLSEGVIRDIFTQMVRAVRHLHKKGFIHGDLKPENWVFVTATDMKIKLVDFGSASYNIEFRQWRDRVRYSLDFAPPELVEADGYAIYSPAIDVYGLGATLYSMIVKHPPYRKNVDDVSQSPEARAEIKERIKKGAFNKDAENWKTASSAFRNLICRCLQRRPEDRPRLKDLLTNSWINDDSSEEEELSEGEAEEDQEQEEAAEPSEGENEEEAYDVDEPFEDDIQEMDAAAA